MILKHAKLGQKKGWKIEEEKRGKGREGRGRRGIWGYRVGKGEGREV